MTNQEFNASYQLLKQVTDGEVRPSGGYRGDMLLGRIRWPRPNELADGTLKTP